MLRFVPEPPFVNEDARVKEYAVFTDNSGGFSGLKIVAYIPEYGWTGFGPRDPHAVVRHLLAELEQWRSHFGCDSPHDTEVGSDTALGKEQERANRAENELKRLRAGLREIAVNVRCPICSSFPTCAPDCRLKALLEGI